MAFAAARITSMTNSGWDSIGTWLLSTARLRLKERAEHLGPPLLEVVILLESEL